LSRPTPSHTFASVKTIKKNIMKQKVQTGIIVGMIFLSATAFGQTNEPQSIKVNDGKKTAKTYMDLMVNVT
jgi:hypothetical protein